MVHDAQSIPQWSPTRYCMQIIEQYDIKLWSSLLHVYTDCEWLSPKSDNVYITQNLVFALTIFILIEQLPLPEATFILVLPTCFSITLYSKIATNHSFFNVINFVTSFYLYILFIPHILYARTFINQDIGSEGLTISLFGFLCSYLHLF